MKVIMCIDERNGLMFNNRRISRDSKVTEDIITMLDKRSLMLQIKSYSKILFENYPERIIINDELPSIDTTDWQFIEDDELIGFENNLEEIILYNWNRHYPSDKKLQLELQSINWELVSQVDFIGNSHNTITKFVYTRKK